MSNKAVHMTAAELLTLAERGAMANTREVHRLVAEVFRLRAKVRYLRGPAPMPGRLGIGRACVHPTELCPGCGAVLVLPAAQEAEPAYVHGTGLVPASEAAITSITDGAHRNLHYPERSSVEAYRIVRDAVARAWKEGEEHARKRLGLAAAPVDPRPCRVCGLAIGDVIADVEDGRPAHPDCVHVEEVIPS